MNKKILILLGLAGAALAVKEPTLKQRLGKNLAQGDSTVVEDDGVEDGNDLELGDLEGDLLTWCDCGDVEFPELDGGLQSNFAQAGAVSQAISENSLADTEE